MTFKIQTFANDSSVDNNFVDTNLSDEAIARTGFRWRERATKDYTTRALTCIALEMHGFTNLFSTRIGGVSPMPNNALNLAGFNEDAAANIFENRRRFLSILNSDDAISNDDNAISNNKSWRLATVYQTHSSDVHRFNSCDDIDNDAVRCDALTIDASENPHVLISVKTADCVPVLLGDTRTGAAASIHAGWRGTVSGIVTRTIEAMKRDYGSHPQDIVAAIGAAALSCCYEVGSDVIKGFHNKRGREAEMLFTPTKDGHARIDLHRANNDELIAAGVKARNVYCAPCCTMHHNNLFFSYRKEKSVYGKVGRLMACIGKAN